MESRTEIYRALGACALRLKLQNSHVSTPARAATGLAMKLPHGRAFAASGCLAGFVFGLSLAGLAFLSLSLAIIVFDSCPRGLDARRCGS
jgi:Na+/H+-translocating membrane pyrophosphatase